MHLIMSLACAYESLNSMWSPNLFVHVSFFFAFREYQGVLSVGKMAIAGWVLQEGTLYYRAPATSFGHWTLWPVLFCELNSVSSYLSPLSRITVLIIPSGSACVGADAHHAFVPKVTLKSVTHELGHPLQLSPKLLIPPCDKLGEEK